MSAPLPHNDAAGDTSKRMRRSSDYHDHLSDEDDKHRDMHIDERSAETERIVREALLVQERVFQKQLASVRIEIEKERAEKEKERTEKEKERAEKEKERAEKEIERSEKEKARLESARMQKEVQHLNNQLIKEAVRQQNIEYGDGGELLNGTRGFEDISVRFDQTRNILILQRQLEEAKTNRLIAERQLKEVEVNNMPGSITTARSLGQRIISEAQQEKGFIAFQNIVKLTTMEDIHRLAEPVRELYSLHYPCGDSAPTDAQVRKYYAELFATIRRVLKINSNVH
ncbi:hypothetical protein HDV05_007403, partial [Chytridiales sp. JEL 0842]